MKKKVTWYNYYRCKKDHLYHLHKCYLLYMIGMLIRKTQLFKNELMNNNSEIVNFQGKN